MRLFYQNRHLHPGTGAHIQPAAKAGALSGQNYSEATDPEIVKAAAAGDVNALACLYDRYSRLLFTVAIRLIGDKESAEELVHDVFLESWRAAGGYQEHRATVRTWLLVRLRSRARDRIRNVSRRRELFAQNKSDLMPKVSRGDEIQLNPDKAAVRRALDTLPVVQRQVIELSYFEGLSSREIASRMGTPIGTVKSRSAAGLRTLRVAMQIGGGA